MSEAIAIFGAIKEGNKLLRAKYGVECPECRRLLPRANPKILLPGQGCTRVGHRYFDPRPELTQADYDATFGATGGESDEAR